LDGQAWIKLANNINAKGTSLEHGNQKNGEARVWWQGRNWSLGAV